MGFQVPVLKLSLLGAFIIFCYPSTKPTISSNVAQAFLFHQLQPVPSAPSLYSSFQENSSASYQQNRQGNPNYQHHHNNRAQNTDQQQTVSYFTQQRQQQQDPSVILNAEDTDEKTVDGCPPECNCNKVAQIADCSNRNLARVPTGFPRDIKRIRLERNNITELGPYAFQGLKRLQRIDLSKNNLLKIDPLAFAGGLQSLNSLILYSNKLNQLPAYLFSELSQLQLLLLNANSLQCISKELFQPLSNLNLLSLYDNNIETLANGTFDGLKNIKTIHLGKNPLVCDCNLRWLADWLELSQNETNQIETSGALCGGPARNQGLKLAQLSKQHFKCEANEQSGSKTNQFTGQCGAASNSAVNDQTCPNGCICNGATVDCSRTSLTESRPGLGSAISGATDSGTVNGGGIYELPDIASDVPVYVTRMRINDNRIKRIRQTGLFQRLANSQKLDLGNNKIIDIEDNAINGGPNAQKPERVVFVLIENEGLCAALSSQAPAPASAPASSQLSNNGDNNNMITPNNQQQQQTVIDMDPCSSAAKVNPPNFDSPCYNGGSCVPGDKWNDRQQSGASGANYSCACPPGFAGPLCEVNIDDCFEHQCQNGAMCVDGINSYRCVCRDPTTTGEFCEQFNSQSFSTSSANSIAPMALPIIAPNSAMGAQSIEQSQPQIYQSPQPARHHKQEQQQILARSADFYRPPSIQSTDGSGASGEATPTCKRVTQRKYYDDGNGCQSVRILKISKCAGICGTSGCCLPAKVKRRRVRMQCNDGASYVKTIELVKKCSCSSECGLDLSQQQQQQQTFARQFNASQEDQLLQITRLDAVD